MSSVSSRIRGDQVTIHDPAVGKRILSLAEVPEHFTGIALELAPTVAFQPQKPIPSVPVHQLAGRVTGLLRCGRSR